MTVRRVRRPSPISPRLARRPPPAAVTRPRPDAAPREEILDVVSGPFERRVAARRGARS
jgi:hypothetical protein